MSDPSEPALPVHFFLQPQAITLERALTLDPDRDWTDLRRAREVWIVQTWNRLCRAGYPATMSDQATRTGIIVYHKEDQRVLLERLPPGATPVLVGVRADFRSCTYADFEVLQNGCYADARRSFYMPHWPQPGMLARDPQRGDRMERIAYKGFVGNLAPEFRSARWLQFLHQQGMTFEDDAVLDDSFDHPIRTRFHDYRDVDLVIAVRRGDTTPKPASKLVNAWQAGIPALLSPDYAFEELRESPLDYLAVRNLAEAEAAVLRLKREPGLYRAMIEHGRRRGGQFTVEKITRRWAMLLFETIPSRVLAHDSGHYGKRARQLRHFWQKIAAGSGLARFTRALAPRRAKEPV
ncbi:MAG: glycosyltransferase [Steroidobacteraceae bacterium]